MNYALNNISTCEQLEHAALHYGMLPFFANRIPGFSVEEMAAPGMLFGMDSGESGCWEWKGPVIQQQTTVYGKFFNRKAGFVSCELLPDFLNYRRHAYPIAPDSTEALLLDLIRAHQCVSTPELRRLVFSPGEKGRRQAFEAPLQRLQMGGWLIIADFEYKYTRAGERYGWGVALYTTPEVWFEQALPTVARTPGESLQYLLDTLMDRLPGANRDNLLRLIS